MQTSLTYQNEKMKSNDGKFSVWGFMNNKFSLTSRTGYFSIYISTNPVFCFAQTEIFGLFVKKLGESCKGCLPHKCYICCYTEDKGPTESRGVPGKITEPCLQKILS